MDYMEILQSIYREIPTRTFYERDQLAAIYEIRQIHTFIRFYSLCHIIA